MEAHVDSGPLLVSLLEGMDLRTAVERFADEHEDGFAPSARYERLLPSRALAEGERLAFRVDLDRCSGCKACVTACHGLNDLDEDEIWREVGQLLGPAGEVQTVTASCHHCEDPACLSGCPVGAYERDPATGIVRHLDDQCFGCQYCLLKCPYDVPRYSAARGIVRKCDMCADRLRVGDAPACVQGCPNEAISIAIVPVGGDRAAEGALLAVGADALPDGGYTRPTTIYASSRAVRASMRRADRGRLEPRASHPPLVAMLVGSQVAVGLSILATAATAWRAAGALPLAGGALALALVSLVASLTHLGRPWLAFRAFLGLRTSWLSREVVAFGAYVGAAALAVVVAAHDPGSPLALAAAAAAAAAGLATVLCSVQVYADTRRPLWAFRRTAPKFFLTVATSGLAVVLVAGLVDARAVVALLAAAAVAKLGVELDPLRHRRRPDSALGRSGRLLAGPLAPALRRRLACGFLGALLLPALALALRTAGFDDVARWVAAAAFVALLAGEVVERTLFFRAEAAPGMPGEARA